MKNKKIISIILPIIVLTVVGIAVFGERRQTNIFHHDSGFIFGTSYNIRYESEQNLKQGILNVLNEVDNSLSPFNKESIITAVNQNKDIIVNEQFTEVFTLAKEVYADTDGAFDITVAPLVNVWGFGFKNSSMPTNQQVDSIKAFIGFDKVELKDGKVTKQDQRTMLDCSAIAKGYGVDKVAKFLDHNGVQNYMVEIGGEIVIKGHNATGKEWKIGVTKPTDDSLATNQEMQTILSISNCAMATSGNYRNFYYKDGKKYAHTIDPKTGYPVQHNILSATVISSTCAKADAYATAFMVMGLEKAREVIARQKDLKAYLIYAEDNGKTNVWYSPGLEKDIEN